MSESTGEHRAPKANPDSDSDSPPKPARRHRLAFLDSLNARLLVGAGAALLLFMVILGAVLDRAFSEAALKAVVDRLQTEVYMLLGATEVRPGGLFTITAPLPEPRLALRESDLYARIFSVEGNMLWRSPSALGKPVIPPTVATPGTFIFERLTPDGDRSQMVFLMHFTVLWEAGRTREALTYQVSEAGTHYGEQVADFRRSLFFWFGMVGVGFLAVNTWLLQRGLRPLRRIAEEVTHVEAGEQEQVTGAYPAELEPLATNLNLLILQGQSHVKRYRNALGDLAHSLKTPLAMMRTALDNPSMTEDDRQAAIEQLNRIDSTVGYQLQRAAAAHVSTFGGSVEVAPIAERLVNTLRKVYAERKLELTLTVTPGARFFGDQGDLYEILGNLADNACKWASSRVSVRIVSEREPGQRRPRFELEVSDDGPGMSAEAFEHCRHRGVRGDTTVDGHGIGLAIVSDLVEEAYEGRLELRESDAGTRIAAVIAFA